MVNMEKEMEAVFERKVVEKKKTLADLQLQGSILQNSASA
jgi:hypothetical protein